jgi:hypothetical protein
VGACLDFLWQRALGDVVDDAALVGQLRMQAVQPVVRKHQHLGQTSRLNALLGNYLHPEQDTPSYYRY